MTERPPLPFDPKDVRRQLQARIVDLVITLGVDKGHINGAMATPLNPARADRSRGSYVIWLDKPREGAWKDFSSQDQGDVFDLIRVWKGLQAWIDAYWWSLDWLNLDRGQVRTAGDAQRDRERRRLEVIAEQARAAADAEAKSVGLMAHWLTLGPLKGSLAEIYLREARRIPLDALAHWPGAIRFDPRCEHHDADTGEVTEWPCMVTVMTRGVKPVGLHRTWLEPDGGGKAPVNKPKKMRGAVRGAAIRLAPGPSGLSPGKADLRGRVDPLAIGEGIETCLTVAAARPDYRVWAAGSLSLMGLLDWPACASAIVLLQDNDWGDQARAAFDGVEARWRGLAEGRPVVVASSAVGSDFNDWAKA